MTTHPAPKKFLFSSDSGRTLCRQILEANLPFPPHDYQLEGLCAALDGQDLFAILPTGSGKTGYIYMFIIIARYLSEHPDECPVKFPMNPVLLAICPTNYIEYQIVSLLVQVTHQHEYVKPGNHTRKARYRRCHHQQRTNKRSIFAAAGPVESHTNRQISISRAAIT